MDATPAAREYLAVAARLDWLETPAAWEHPQYEAGLSRLPAWIAAVCQRADAARLPTRRLLAEHDAEEERRRAEAAQGALLEAEGQQRLALPTF